MNRPNATDSETDNQDRWVRPLNVPPGHWKKQLSGKLRSLAVQGKLDQLKELIATDPTLLNKRGSHGRTFLFEAVRKNRRETALWLLKRGADVQLTGCYNSESIVQLDPLTAAAYYGRKSLIEPLEQHGARRDVFRAAFMGDSDAVNGFLEQDSGLLHAEDPSDEIYYTPLVSFSVAGGQLEMLEHLVDCGASLHPYDAQLLYIAAHMGRTSILEYLLDRGVSPRTSDATLWMATSSTTDLKLLVKSGLSPNQKPYHGLHPLMYACRADKRLDLPKVKLLIELGATVNAVGPQGRTALHYAARGGNAELCAVLVKAGADRSSIDDQGTTPFDVAALHGHRVAVDILKPPLG